MILALWVFPHLWYTKTSATGQFFWLTEHTNVAGWAYREIPVAEAAEAVLVADRLSNGEFSDGKGDAVRVFSAKRYDENENEIGLFVHTPDRCWTETGWRIDPVQPDVIELHLHGIKMSFERRLFVGGDEARELVYFGGLTGGQPLPYRLDHNLSVGIRYHLAAARDKTGTTLRTADRKLWTRVWESFASRRPLLGPKQFIRISTPVTGSDLDESDQLLRQFLSEWLKPVDYEKELAAWRASRH